MLDLTQGAERAFWRSRNPNEVKLGETGEMQKKQLHLHVVFMFSVPTPKLVVLGTQSLPTALRGGSPGTRPQ